MAQQHGAVHGRAVGAGNTAQDAHEAAGPRYGRPEDDPVLTVRMQPPATWDRCLDLATPRAVKIAQSAILPWASVDPRCVAGLTPFLSDDEVRDWPLTDHVSDGAAQRLAHPAYYRRPETDGQQASDEDESPFR